MLKNLVTVLLPVQASTIQCFSFLMKSNLFGKQGFAQRYIGWILALKSYIHVIGACERSHWNAKNSGIY